MFFAPTGAALAGPEGAEAFIQSFGDRALKVARDGDGRRAGLAEIVEGSVDLPALGRFALGPFLRQSNPKRVEEYLAVFRSYALMAYPAMLANLDLRQFQVTRARPVNGETSIVTTRVGYGDSDPVEVGWYVREQPPGTYKIQDVNFEGHSLRSFQRAKFERILRDRWIDGLIKILQGWVANGREEPYLQ